MFSVGREADCDRGPIGISEFWDFAALRVV
jgi:hypothetical protein